PLLDRPVPPRPDRAPSVDPVVCLPAPTIADALARPDATAAALTMLEPGAESTGTLLALIPARLSNGGLIDALIATERQLATVQARQQQLLAELAQRDPDGEQYLRDEVACALRLAPATAHRKLQVAVALTGPLWDTFTGLQAGQFSYGHGRILATATDPLSDQVTARVQARVLPRAGTQTPGEFRAAVRRAVARFDTRDQAARHAVAYADRRVVQYPEVDAMASIWLHLAADGAATIMTALNARAAAAKEPGDCRTADQRRADAAVEIALAALDNPNLPTTHRPRPAVSVTIAESTLHGDDEQPAELDGYGPIPATMARRIATHPDTTLRHWLVDQHGRLPDQQAGIAATTAYQPTTAIT